jgi:hypothetical protein
MTNDDIWVLQTSDEDDLLVSSQPPSQGGGVSASLREFGATILLQPFGVHLGSPANIIGKAGYSLSTRTSVHYTTFGTPFQLMPFIDGSNTALF